MTQTVFSQPKPVNSVSCSCWIDKSYQELSYLRKAFGYIRAKFGNWAMSSDSIEEHDMMHKIARGTEVSS